MNKSFWIILFLFVLIATLTGIYFGIEQLRMITKPLLMPILFFYFLSSTKKYASQLKTWVVLAVFFSWVGDILLMFEASGKIYFMLGLASFLLAQFFYVVYFNNIRARENIKGNALLLLVAVIYYSALTTILGPSLEKAKLGLPVRIYGVVLSFMLMLALHSLLGKNKKAGWLMAIGAILFVISDSTLAFNKFYSPINYGDLIVMLTYGLAQLLITMGSVEYISSMNRITESTRVRRNES